jgi:hypothetical protein
MLVRIVFILSQIALVLNLNCIAQANDIKDLFIDTQLSISRYHPIKRKVYGLTRINKVTSYVVISPGSTKPKVIKQFKEIHGLVGNASALDTDNDRFIFWGRVNNIFTLYVLDTLSGKVLYKHVPKSFFTTFAYNPMSGKLISILRSKDKKKGHLIEMDIATGNYKKVAKIPGFSQLISSAFYIDLPNQRILALARVKEKTSLIEFHQATAKITVRQTNNVSLNEYRVHRFNGSSTTSTLSTANVQSCTGIVGYSSNTKIGFIAHISPNNTKVSQLLTALDIELKKQDSKGLKAMKIEICGGLKKDPKSFQNAIKVYRELQNKYGIKLSGTWANHIGKNYNVILSADEVYIF